MRLCHIILCLIGTFCISSANNGHEPINSPRKALLTTLASNGCTNKLLAHYAIDAANNGIPASIVNQRLKGAANYDPTLMAKW